jgi:hypothetical protein
MTDDPATPDEYRNEQMADSIYALLSIDPETGFEGIIQNGLGAMTFMHERMLVKVLQRAGLAASYQGIPCRIVRFDRAEVLAEYPVPFKEPSNDATA